MSLKINETHDPELRSWIVSANDGKTDFPIQNLPFAVFRRKGLGEEWRGGVAIGDQIVDLRASRSKARASFAGAAKLALDAGSHGELNALMELGPNSQSALRTALSRVLRTGSSARRLIEPCLVPQSVAEYRVPTNVGDYTDFYTSMYHATRVGALFRPDRPLMPNYKWVPIGYHGRSSSVIISGRNFKRPVGQVVLAGATRPVVRASERMDVELELGVFTGPSNSLGGPVPMVRAEDHVFGFVLLNDWSARDIQPWEYQPLGPFLAKNFATTISPWVITTEALAPFRVPPLRRPPGDPEPLPYLDSDFNRTLGAVDVNLEILLQTARMQNAGTAPIRLCLTNYRYAYWTFAQMVAHHTVNGCNLRAGDLLGTGTLSGPDSTTQAAAMIEMTRGGQNPITLPTGEERTFLEDGDCITLRAWCAAGGAVRIGFGECQGTVLPAGDD